MDEQDITQDLALPGAQELLTSTAMSRLAYNGADGFPRLIPIGFLWNGHEIVVCTATTSPKVQALTRRPQVAVTIDAGDTPGSARALMIRGLARVEIVDGVAEEYLAMARKTMEPDAAAEFETNVRAMFRQQARIAITPQWARFFDFGAGRMPRFLQEMAEQAARN